MYHVTIVNEVGIRGFVWNKLCRSNSRWPPKCHFRPTPLATVFVYVRGSIATVPEVVFSRGILGVSIGVRLEGVGVHDAFVEDESVAFGTCDDSEVFGGGIPPEEIGVDDINVTSFVERLSDLIDQVLTHDIIVELMGATNVQGEPSDFTADFTLLGSVAVVLGTCGSEFGDEIVTVEFVRHFS